MDAVKKPIGFRRILRYGWPWFWLEHLTQPVPPGLWLVNGFCQRILRINGAVPWMVHFTSCVSGDVRIGRGVRRSFAMSGGAYVQGGNGIFIGDDTRFATGVKLISANHDPQDLGVWKKAPPIRIGKRCWIGANAVILPGVELGDDVVVGAGAVVTRSVASGTTVVGIPARPLVRRPETEEARP